MLFFVRRVLEKRFRSFPGLSIYGEIRRARIEQSISDADRDANVNIRVRPQLGISGCGAYFSPQGFSL